jgi:hypothetical protein
VDHPNQVVEILFPNETPDSKMESVIKAMKEKILASDDFVNLFVGLIKSDPEKIGQLRLHAIRRENQAGVILKVELFRNDGLLKNRPKRKWHCGIKVILDNEPLRSYENEGDLAQLSAIEEYRYFKEDMNKALERNQNASFSVSLLFETCSYCERLKDL